MHDEQNINILDKDRSMDRAEICGDERGCVIQVKGERGSFLIDSDSKVPCRCVGIHFDF